MEEAEYVTRNVVLEKGDERIVIRRAQRMGLGPKGFSAALRTIIRDWAKLAEVHLEEASAELKSE